MRKNNLYLVFSPFKLKKIIPLFGVCMHRSNENIFWLFCLFFRLFLSMKIWNGLKLISYSYSNHPIIDCDRFILQSELESMCIYVTVGRTVWYNFTKAEPYWFRMNVAQRLKHTFTLLQCADARSRAHG